MDLIVGEGHHDLFIDVVESLGSHVDKLEIVSITDNAFFARLCMTSASGEITETDCRPSDGIAIALRANAPILVAPEVMAQALVEVEREFENAASRTKTGRDDQFHQFISSVKPADFVLPHLQGDIEKLEELLELDPLEEEENTQEIQESGDEADQDTNG
jgi:hypothetical protein